MFKIFRTAMYLFITITGITALLTLVGICIEWFNPKNSNLPYLEWLIGSVVIEIVTVTIIFVKKGLKYMPEVVIDKDANKTLKFMEEFISLGTSATIVSNRVSWLSSNNELIETLKKKVESGIRIEIVTPKSVSEELKKSLKGGIFLVTNEPLPPEARFTLVNADRSGAEKLAIARGVHPEHEITIFDNNSGPQIIAMAKDIINKARRLSNAKQME